MRLKYVGISPADNGGIVPLPEGWPAADHDEDDEALAAEKLASGKYQQDKSAPPAEPPAAPAAEEA